MKGGAYSFFDYGGHIQNMIAGDYGITKIRAALQKGKKLSMKILKQIPFDGKNYYGDLQKLAYEECCLIENYQ